MKQPAIFFDRDNTLIVSDGYLGDPAQVQLVDGAAEAVARAKRLGYAAVVFSNQSGVARGMFDEQAVRDVNARMDQMLKEQDPNAVIDHHEFCPYHPEAPIAKYRKDSRLRKPKPGMILSAANKLSLDLGKSWVIGDAPRDIEAGKAAGLRTILFRSPTLSPSPAAETRSKIQPDYTVASLKEAMDVIERQNPRGGRRKTAPTALARPGASIAPGAAPEAAEATPPQSTAPQAPEAEAGAATSEKPPPATGGQSSAPPAGTDGPDGTARSMIEVAPAPSSQGLPRAAGLPAIDGAAVLATAAQLTPRPELAKLQATAEQILQELRRRNEREITEFSAFRLLGSIVQVIVLAVLFFAYLNYQDPAVLQPMLLLAAVLQAMTISLLVMGKRR